MCKLKVCRINYAKSTQGSWLNTLPEAASANYDAKGASKASRGNCFCLGQLIRGAGAFESSKRRTRRPEGNGRKVGQGVS